MDIDIQTLLSNFFAAHPFYGTILGIVCFFFIVVLFRGWPAWHDSETEDEEDDTDNDNTNSITGNYSITYQKANEPATTITITITKN